ncbi:iron-siderophore ABC transporter substrate-binding protein [Pleurocapsales cyanobacterium LEGE 06147]|nr:iron-siderophore ABC transporter substrate-binding protein [Pleurocapsales cyanobacterium LEGE 06147]
MGGLNSLVRELGKSLLHFQRLFGTIRTNQQRSLSRRGFLLGLLTGLLISACRRQVAQAPTSQLVAGECRVVQHDFGETFVPMNPQRLIATDENALEVSLALGIKPIAAGEPNLVSGRARHLAGKTEGIASLGKEEQLNLEKMVQLNPDLILGFPIFSENYQVFSQIAPTISFDYTHTGWKDKLRRVGELLGKTQQAEQLLAQYQARIEEFQQAMGERLEQTEVSVVRFYAGFKTAEFRTKSSFPGSILEEVGLPRPAAQRQPVGPGETFVMVSLERLDLLDGDAIFAALDPGAKDSFRRFQTSPLWQSLKAVKNDRVYVVDSGYWIFGNILAANAILDDLFKYLLQEENINDRTESLNRT